MHDPQVLIVGAGIAGLAVGRALLSRGVSAEIVDRATAFQLGRVDAIHVGSIEEVDLDPFVDRRVVLVGDAAHATSPNMAQGASMALESSSRRKTNAGIGRARRTHP